MGIGAVVLLFNFLHIFLFTVIFLYCLQIVSLINNYVNIILIFFFRKMSNKSGIDDWSCTVMFFCFLINVYLTDCKELNHE